MPFEAASYQAYLKNVLVERAKKNPSFSLRAMARMFGLQPSLLSEVLNGRRNLTEESAIVVAQKLGLDEKERIYFRTLVQLGRTKNPEVKKVLLKQLADLYPRRDKVYDLSVDRFVCISDWHHFAILRLLEIEAFQFTPASIAAALGIHAFEADAAIERLERLELLEKSSDGRYRKTEGDLLVQSQEANAALRKYHAQMLEKTISALTQDSPTERFTGTENIVLNPDQLKEASKIFEECFDKILALSRARKSKPDAPSANVYHLGIHMIPLSKIHRKGNRK